MPSLKLTAKDPENEWLIRNEFPFMVYFVGPLSEAKLLLYSLVYKFGSPPQDASHYQDEVPESQLPKPNENLKPQTSTASERLGVAIHPNVHL